ncbi:uncharacterized protein J8A68_005007 [[Candida] subhashii]|uniref:Uncharacterized protein n=1 Tax=[Candida] subhashii TaxID=561895 RepID=A0A8J5UW58_9ASCO|nr:uncharacterized protein J8A68_005007 [[Candida] subhashii]KAG7661429.1 hypothetical protein J8A68_005007 [[Candida] subhashii]
MLQQRPRDHNKSTKRLPPLPELAYKEIASRIRLTHDNISNSDFDSTDDLFTCNENIIIETITESIRMTNPNLQRLNTPEFSLSSLSDIFTTPKSQLDNTEIDINQIDALTQSDTIKRDSISENRPPNLTMSHSTNKTVPATMHTFDPVISDNIVDHKEREEEALSSKQLKQKFRKSLTVLNKKSLSSAIKRFSSKIPESRSGEKQEQLENSYKSKTPESLPPITSPNKNHRKRNPNPKKYDSVPATPKTNMRLDTEPNHNNQPNSTSPFWKYHILRFGRDLYLTTNPGMKHMYCRNAPGYYIIILDHEQRSRQPYSKKGFTLIFKDTSNKTKDIPLMIIVKKAESEGGHFELSIPKNRVIKKGGAIWKDCDDYSLFNGIGFPREIENGQFPFEKLRQIYPENCFRNFEVRDLNKMKWNIGSIPRVRSSNLNKVKQKLTTPANESNEEDIMKLSGKRNIYFHQNFIQDDKQPSRYKLSNPEEVYLCDPEIDFPPVLAVFRPNDSRISKQFKKSIPKSNKHHYKQSMQSSYLSINEIDTDYGTGTNQKKYYHGSDGLYFSKNTKDDNPDENKLGWMNIYDDPELFEGTKNRGMFEFVVGMTVAVGLDSLLPLE